MTNILTQKKLAFYKLYEAHQINPNRYIPTWEFVGEINVVALNSWGLMSYKCPTRLTDIYLQNPNLIERELVTGKSGAKYYSYRIKTISEATLIDPALVNFYNSIKKSDI